ncbi:MAG: InlB B-repeat-containing protein [Lachnospiraceae bacterium]|nr:InlB B-repeat-containing protein [Lachnospiraceae bacterium]
MKKGKISIFIAAMVMGAVLLTGCGKDEGNIGSTEPDTQQQVQDNVTVTFYDADGSTVLETKEVAAGTCVEEYTPQKDGFTFAGWFATPQMSHKFDFATEITEDTDLFAGFVSYQEDTRTYAILGSGSSPLMMESNWGKTINEGHMMVKEDNDQANVYTITLDLNEGDEFQFAIDSDWHNQRGYGYLDTISKDGKDYFANAGSLGEASTKRANIKCAVSGNYTFALTTYPAEDVYETDAASYTEDNKEAFNISLYDTITWTYNGAASAGAEDIVTDYYIKGAKITDWQDVYTDETKFVENNGIYTLEITLEEGDEFLFTTLVTAGDNSSVGTEYVRYTNIAADDAASLACVTEGGGANMVAASAGTYVFTYDPASTVLKVEMK